MESTKIIVAIVVVLIVLGAGRYIAEMVKSNPDEMDCIIGLGSDDNPVLCYGWDKTDIPGILK